MATAEIVLNGDFELGTTDWVFQVDAFEAPGEGIGGSNCAGMKDSPGTEIYQKGLTVVKGAYYDLTLYAKGVTDSTFRMSVVGLNSLWVVALVTRVVGSDYTKYRFNFRTEDDFVLIRIQPVKLLGTLYVDNISLRGTVLSFKADTRITVREDSSGTDVDLEIQNVQGGLYSLFIPSLGGYVSITNNIQTEPTGTIIPAPSYNPAFQSSANCAEYVNYFLFNRDWKPLYPDYLYTLVTDESQAHELDGRVCLTYGIRQLKDYVNTHNVAFTSV